MASRGSKVDGDSGGRNKTLLIVAVVLLCAAGAWMYFGRGQNIEEAVREQVAAKTAANPAPATPAENTDVAVPEEKKDEATASTEEPTEETTPEGTPVKKKPLAPKAGRSIK